MASPSPLDQLISQGVSYAKFSLSQNPVVSQLISQTPVAPLFTPATPSTLLPLLPLLASTSQLTLAVSEYLTLRPLVQSHREKDIPGKAIQSYFEGWWIPVGGVVGAMGLVGVAAGSWAASRATGVRSRALYLVGTGFALGHFAFLPTVSFLLLLSTWTAFLR